ncbi:hypothetical protein [Pseudomonas sp. R1-7]|uniref:hypothetical protein n=1 Tax=Pseudomonas sp. R1-7 TaxID=2817398 RepID=UPI003DA8AAF0
MSIAARKAAIFATEVNFTANLEDNSSFNASVTKLESSTTPGRGDIWVVVATEWVGGRPRTFTITFSKDKNQATNETVTDQDLHATLHFNDYNDQENPTYQKARSGTISYFLDPTTLHFSGSFRVNIDKSDGTGRYACAGEFETDLSR